MPLTWEPREHRLLEEAATRYACSPYMMVHAAFAAALSELGAGEDVPVVVALSGRDGAATDGLVGCVTNPVVLRVRTHGAPTGVELTARVRRSLLAAHAHQDHPYERVLEHLDRDRADRGRGLFTVACSYLRTEPPHPGDTDWPGGLRVTPASWPPPTPTRTCSSSSATTAPPRAPPPASPANSSTPSPTAHRQPPSASPTPSARSSTNWPAPRKRRTCRTPGPIWHRRAGRSVLCRRTEAGEFLGQGGGGAWPPERCLVRTASGHGCGAPPSRCGRPPWNCCGTAC